MMEKFDANNASGLLVPDGNEDSVDIYDDLDIGLCSNAERSSSKASQLKESMDLYEELVTEEQHSRESTYTELKSRFQAAQNQINDLRRRLEQMELQNTGLNTENYRLKKNISVLLQTARLEVTRKDAEILRLNQQAQEGHRPYQSHFNNLRDQKLSNRPSIGSSKTRPLPPPPSCPPPPPPPPLPAPPPRDDPPPQPAMKECNTSTHQPSGSSMDTRSSKASSKSNSEGSTRVDCDVPTKRTPHPLSKSSSSSSTRHSESDKHKSKHREEKCKNPKSCESTDRKHRSGSDPKDCNAPEKNRPDRRSDSGSSKSRNHINVEGHHRSERAKSPLPEVLKDVSSSDDKKQRSRERRQDKAKMSTADSERSASHSSKEGSSRDHKKSNPKDGHIRSSDSKERKKSSLNQQAECSKDSSKEREGKRLSKDYPRKDHERRKDESSRKHKKSTSSERSREHEKHRPKESDKSKVEVCSKERTEDTQEASRPTANISERSCVEENSPNRKLCFMETLNLTLSPIKKPVLPIDVSQNVLTPVDQVVENRLDESQPNIEDMCVIDELHSCELEEEFEKVTKQPPDIPKTPSPGKTHTRSEDDANDVQGNDQHMSETTAKDRQLEVNSGQTTSAHSQPLDTAKKQMTVHLTSKPLESTPPKATDGHLLKNYEDNNKLASDSKIDKCRSLRAADCVKDMSVSINIQLTSNSLQKVNLVNNTDQSIAVEKSVVLGSSVEPMCRTPTTAVEKSPKEGAAASSSRHLVAEDVTDKADPESSKMSPTILPQGSTHGLCPPASTSIHQKDAHSTQDCQKDANIVSSTISLDSLPQEGLSLPDAIYVLTQTNLDSSGSSDISTEPSSSTGCLAVSKVSSTTEETALPGKHSSPTVTPKKSFGPGKSHENNIEASSSMPLFHDEDSMMRTLNNLKRIPDAISPLRSPIQITKRSHLHLLGKPGHVKSLQKDFSSTPIDANSKKLDVNKENKYPGGPAIHDKPNLVDKCSDQPSSLSDTELEEGEILSESDEASTDLPTPANKKVKLTRPVRHKQSPKSLLNRTSGERGVSSKEIAGASTPSPKSRFKTVRPAVTKASFSTIEEVMDTFKLVRTEMRKKYMKLHKTFPRKSFYGVMDNFQESFLEFVDGAHFAQISSQDGELKSNLKKVIASVFSTISNNGIVKRIFEQQAVDLKQKLWDFVDNQVNFLFKDIYTTLKGLCKPARARTEDSRPSGNEKVPRQPPVKKPQCQQKEVILPPNSLNGIKPGALVPYRTGLGSRGKDIRITHGNEGQHPTNCPHTQTVVNFLPPKSFPSNPENNNRSSLVVSQNGSLLDKTDFEILTEQQASSLTFNLVRDSQMGEIFKCLLQGSDLLESSGITGDNTTWSLSTPRKDGERLLSITTPSKFDSPSKLLSPVKFDTPSKLIATWATISPRKMMSARYKDRVPLNPAFFDESCLLEVPSENRATLPSSFSSNRSYSILAEDLAVSLTIPSPLKSDSHLSFLQPSSGMRLMSTPDSVISAHISEDALLEGEDATEQDIHLALDTDNSSCCSGSSLDSEVLATPFMFKPDVPMQALVMERSNDHFIVKIRQSSTGADTTLTADDSFSHTLTEEDHQCTEDDVVTQARRSNVSFDQTLNAVPSGTNLFDLAGKSGTFPAATEAATHHTQDENLTLTKNSSLQKVENTSNVCLRTRTESPKDLPNTTPSDGPSFGQISKSSSREATTVTADKSPSQTHHREEDTTTRQRFSKGLLTESDNTERDGVEVSESERSLTIAEDVSSSTPEKQQRDRGRGRKRKRHKDKSEAKRPRGEEEESTEEMVSTCKKNRPESKSPPACLSPNSLSAKNVVRKKGEVVMSWSRDEDRAILIDLKIKGASRDTFSALSERLNKPSAQIATRFYQLMKLFKKQEKMDP